MNKLFTKTANLIPDFCTNRVDHHMEILLGDLGHNFPQLGDQTEIRARLYATRHVLQPVARLPNRMYYKSNFWRFLSIFFYEFIWRIKYLMYSVFRYSEETP